MSHLCMPVKGPLSPESFAHQPRTPTPSAPAQKSTRSIAPQRPLLNRSPLPAFKLRFSNLAAMLGATDVSYPMGGEAQARIPAPGLSPLRVFFPLASLSLFIAHVSARRASMWQLPSVCYLFMQMLCHGTSKLVHSY